MRSARFCTLALALLALPFALGACVSGVNGSVDVAAGTSVSDATTVNGSVHVEANAKADKASTVNGSIHLAEGAKVGSASTVNGGITLGEHATAGSIDTVNGGVTLGKDAVVSGDITAVNGTLDLAAGSAVNGKLTNVNSKITIDSAHVGQGITTVNGDMDISGQEAQRQRCIRHPLRKRQRADHRDRPRCHGERPAHVRKTGQALHQRSGARCGNDHRRAGREVQRTDAAGILIRAATEGRRLCRVQDCRPVRSTA
jgi:acetyltransferase-like isoleucine patch superfamily enzyme